MSDKLNMPPARHGRRITVTFSPPALMGALLGLCAGFALVFTLGVLLGRGYNLEKTIPELERVLPTPAATQPPQIIAEDEPLTPPDAAAGNTAVATVAEDRARPAGIIAPGDLEYRDNLKNRAAPARQAAQNPPSKPSPNADARAKPPSKPVETAKPAAKPEAKTGAKAGADTQVYHYVYQVAAYKAEGPCAAFTNKLKKAGFKARMLKSTEGGVTWYRTMIDFTGKPDETDALREKLKNHGVPKAIIKGKTPAR